LREEGRLRVLENRVLRRIFGPKRDEVTRSGENYLMRSLVSVILTNIVRVIKSTIRWARHVANIGETRGVYGF
jgi:hypothetical protein